MVDKVRVYGGWQLPSHPDWLTFCCDQTDRLQNEIASVKVMGLGVSFGGAILFHLNSRLGCYLTWSGTKAQAQSVSMMPVL